MSKIDQILYNQLIFFFYIESKVIQWVEKKAFLSSAIRTAGHSFGKGNRQRLPQL